MASNWGIRLLLAINIILNVVTQKIGKTTNIIIFIIFYYHRERNLKEFSTVFQFG